MRSGTRWAPLAARRVVCRTGSPIDMGDLHIASPQTAKAIIVLSPRSDHPDAEVIKTLLALTNAPDRRQGPYHIVAELHEPTNLEVARMVGKDEVEFVLVGDLVARIIAQTCREIWSLHGLHRVVGLRRRRNLLQRGAGIGRQAVSRRAPGQ